MILNNILYVFNCRMIANFLFHLSKTILLKQTQKLFSIKQEEQVL